MVDATRLQRFLTGPGLCLLPLALAGGYALWFAAEWQGPVAPRQSDHLLTMLAMTGIYGTGVLAVSALRTRRIVGWVALVWYAAASLTILVAAVLPSPGGLSITITAQMIELIGLLLKAAGSDPSSGIFFLIMYIFFPAVAGACFGFLLLILQRGLGFLLRSASLLMRHLLGGAATGLLLMIPFFGVKWTSNAELVPLMMVPCLLPHLIATGSDELIVLRPLSGRRVLHWSLAFCCLSYGIAFLDSVLPDPRRHHVRSKPALTLKLFTSPFRSIDLSGLHPRPGRPPSETPFKLGGGSIVFARGEVIDWHRRPRQASYDVLPQWPQWQEIFSEPMTIKLLSRAPGKRPLFKPPSNDRTGPRCRSDLWQGATLCRDFADSPTNKRTGRSFPSWLDTLPQVENPNSILDTEWFGHSDRVMVFAESGGTLVKAYCSRHPEHLCRAFVEFRASGAALFLGKFTLPHTDLPNLMAIATALDQWFSARVQSEEP